MHRTQTDVCGAANAGAGSLRCVCLSPFTFELACDATSGYACRTVLRSTSLCAVNNHARLCRERPPSIIPLKLRSEQHRHSADTQSQRSTSSTQELRQILFHAMLRHPASSTCRSSASTCTVRRNTRAHERCTRVRATRMTSVTTFQMTSHKKTCESARRSALTLSCATHPSASQALLRPYRSNSRAEPRQARCLQG